MAPVPSQMSADCRRSLTEPSEGLRLHAYYDCVGVLTIGYGHTSRAGQPAVTPTMQISEAAADAILSRDLRIFERGVADLLKTAKAPVLQREFDALVDLAFNIGMENFKKSSLLRAYLAGDKATAALKFMDWNKAGGREVAGLTRRRRRDRDWFLVGKLATTAVAFLNVDDEPPPESLPHSHDWIDSPDAADDRDPIGSLIWWGAISILAVIAVFVAFAKAQ